MSSFVNRLFALVAILTALALTPLSVLAQATPSPAADPATSLQRGVEWLLSQQGDDGAWIGFTGESDPGVTIDAVIALAAAANAGVEVDLTAAIQYLSETGLAYADSGTGQAAKLILAAVAAGEDPTTFAGLNSVEEMLEGYNGGSHMYGTGMYDTALVVLALAAVGKTPSDVILKTMRRTQLADGSWSFDGTTQAGNGDTNTTALVVQALVAIDYTKDNLILHGVEYLQRSQLAQGFPFQTAPGATPDANSTALVIQALLATGEDPAAQQWQNVLGSLIAFQTADGAFSYQLDPLEPNLFATIQALPPLAGQAFPVLGEGIPATPVAMPTCTPEQLAATPAADSPLPCAA